MGKTSPLTGTGKKAQKADYKARKFAAEEFVKEAKHDRAGKRSAKHDLRQIGKGKGLPKYEKADYQKQTLHGLMKDFERAGRGAEKIFEPIKQEALANFDQYTTPDITNQFGRESGGGSSALNQAMAAARGNLQRSLASDFAGLQANLAQNFLGQREQSRQFGSQFQAGENQFANQSALANLNARMQAHGGIMGNPIQPISGGLQPSYNPKQGGTSGMGGTLVGGALGALGSYLGAGGTFGMGGSAAASIPTTIASIGSTAFSSRDVKENIQDYNKGLEVIRELDVKNYDYKIPLEGRQQNRVGLIAEDVPEELQAMIGNIKGVDVYGLVSLLVNCIKQLDEKVKILEAA